jgi:hypothetical protein
VAQPDGGAPLRNLEELRRRAEAAGFDYPKQSLQREARS